MAQDTRTKTLLEQLAGNGELDLRRLLAPGHVAVAIGEDADQVQAQLLFSFAVNLAARLHPVVQRLTVVVAQDAPLTDRIPRWRRDSLSEHIKEMLASLRPPLEWDVVDALNDDVQVTLIVGCALSVGVPLYVGSRGWMAYYSPNDPCPVGGDPNPVGAHAAACVGVGEIWKQLLHSHREIFAAVPIRPQTDPLSFSTLTYRLGEQEEGGLHKSRMLISGLAFEYAFPIGRLNATISSG